VVFNMQAPQTLDGKIVQTMYERIQQVVTDMAPLGGEYRPGLEDDILGQVADLLDVEDILAEAGTIDIRRTEERIQEALEKAKQAAELQRTLYEYFAGYDAQETKGELRLSIDHVRAFVVGMCRNLGVEISEELHRGAVLALKLTDELREKLSMRGAALRITFDREHVSVRTGTQMMDFESEFFKLLVARAKEYGFDALVAKITGLKAEAIVTAMLRWQNDQGHRMREEYFAIIVRTDGSWDNNPDSYLEWLLEPASEGEHVGPQERARLLRETAESEMDKRLGEVSNADLHPENRQLIGAGWLQPIANQ